MYRIEFLNIQVRCPGNPCKIETMQIRMMNGSTGKTPAPCQGCNSLNGTKPCQWCCAAITAMFFQDPELDVTRPLSPAFPPQKTQ